jgi:hypothetical protein
VIENVVIDDQIVSVHFVDHWNMATMNFAVAESVDVGKRSEPTAIVVETVAVLLVMAVANVQHEPAI